MLDHERSQRIRLEQTVEDLAKQHNFLEEACRERVVPKHKLAEKSQRHAVTVGSPTIQQSGETTVESSDDEMEFYDAIAEEPEDFSKELGLETSLSFSSSSSEANFISEKKDKVMSHKRSSSDYGASISKTPAAESLRPHSASVGDLVTVSSSVSLTLGALEKFKVGLLRRESVLAISLQNPL